MLASAFALFGSSTVAIYILWIAVILIVYIVGFIIACIAILIVNVFLAEDGNIIEASFLALYIVTVACTAMVEEATVGAPLLSSQWLQTYGAFLTSDDMRAVTLVVTLMLLFLSLGRAAQFFRVLVYGHDAAYAIDGSMVDDNQKENDSQQTTQTGNDAPDDEIQRRPTSLNSSVPKTAPSNTARTAVQALTLLAATFRVLIWAGAINTGEYLPLPCRAWQIATVTALYAIFVRM